VTRGIATLGLDMVEPDQSAQRSGTRCMRIWQALYQTDEQFSETQVTRTELSVSLRIPPAVPYPSSSRICLTAADALGRTPADEEEQWN
jgi:hypothetical protein